MSRFTKCRWLGALGFLLVLTSSGCGGVSGSGSVSPASFFLPGIIQVKPTPEGPAETLREIPLVIVSR